MIYCITHTHTYTHKYMHICIHTHYVYMYGIYYHCYYISTIPDNMKISVIIPLFKKGKPDDINNYRPIALLSQFSKIFEKIISNRFLHFTNKHNLLSH